MSDSEFLELVMERAFQSSRTDLPDPYSVKRAAALEFLGRRWLLHPENAPIRVQRGENSET